MTAKSELGRRIESLAQEYKRAKDELVLNPGYNAVLNNERISDESLNGYTELKNKFLEVVKNLMNIGIPVEVLPGLDDFRNSVSQIDNFIYIPSINLYVAKERSHFGEDWFQAYKLLNDEGLRMPTIPEFIEFLKYTKNNFPEIYNDITEVRDPWRAEWFDANFKVKDKKLHINYYHVLDSSGNLIPRNSEVLDKDTLMENKIPGISLEDYLTNNHTKQGLPSEKVKSGNFCYWYPISDNNSVVTFYVYSSGGAGLRCCGRGPSYRNSSLGVFAVRNNEKKEDTTSRRKKARFRYYIHHNFP